MSVRKASVKGSFYPSSPEEIAKMFAYYNEILDENSDKLSISKIKPRAVIVPHAGYIYSAFTANIAYRTLQNRKPKRVVVIGPSHKVYIKGVSIADYDYYETPFGNLKIDEELNKSLKKNFNIPFVPSAHNEHSTEVQMPFLKYYLNDVSIVELVYGEEDSKDLKKIINFVLKDRENAVVISTDLSHYYDIKKANTLDNICLEAIWRLDTKKLHQGCEACGKIGVEAMILSAKEYNLKPILLDYRTSADVSKDDSQVVGYLSVAFTES